jgi:dihydrofolate reductase
MGLAGLSIIAAIGRNRELGKDRRLLWRMSDDMGRFRTLTMGHPVIMGRKTWESLSGKFRPLPGRMNIVVTRQADYEANAIVVDSFEAAHAMVAMCHEIFVIGGGELYAVALPHANRLYLTLVDAEAEADTFFPQYGDDFRIIAEEPGTGDPPHRFLVLERK